MNQVTQNKLVERVRRLFGEAPCRLQVAALPWRMKGDTVEVMLITSRDTGRWVLPKGWPERAEELCEAAAREAVEEAGIKGSVSRLACGRYFYLKTKPSSDGLNCEVLVYPLEVDTVAEKWKEKRQRTRRWFSGGEARDRVHEPDLGDLIAAFCAAPQRA